MANPKTQAATQLRNIEESTGMTVADFAAEVSGMGIEKHGKIVTLLKSGHGLTHGNANLLAHAVRERLAGGPPSAEELLAAQYKGGKAALRPIYDELAAIAESFGEEVDKVIQKTGVSFRRKKQFALVQAPSSKRVQLGLNLDALPDDSRIVATNGMCTHKVDITDPNVIDDDIVAAMRAAYDRAG